MRCSKCKQTIPSSSQFCPYCGAKTVETKVCNKCGYKTEEEYVFCPVCGERLVKEISDGTQSLIENNADVQTVKPVRKFSKIAENPFIKKVIANRKTIERVAIAVLCLLIFICSFFTIAEADITEGFKQGSVSESEYDNVRVEGKITYNLDTLDLIEFEFFTIGLNENKAMKFMEEFDYGALIYDYLGTMIGEDNVHYEGDYVYITNKACKELSELVSGIPVLKMSYAEYMVANESEAEKSMFVYKAAGIFSLLLILMSFVTFVVATVSIFRKKDLAQSRLLLTLLAMIIVICALLCAGDATLPWKMGGAAVASVVFIVLIITYKIVVNILESKKIEWQKFLVGATCAIMGIIVASMFVAPAVNVTIYGESNNAGSYGFTSKYTVDYSFNNSELFDEYDSEPVYTYSGIKEKLDEDIKLYSSYNDISTVQSYFKETYGINAFVCNDVFSENYGSIISAAKTQPYIAFISLIFGAALLASGLSAMAGNKTSKAFKYIALVIIVICAAYNIVIPFAIDQCIASIKGGILCHVASDASVTVGLLFGIIGIVACAFMKLLRGKTTQWGKYKNVESDCDESDRERKQETTAETLSAETCDAYVSDNVN